MKEEFLRTLRKLRECSVTGKAFGVLSPTRDHSMLNKYRLFQRAKGVFYWQDNESGKQGSLRTKDRRAAEKLLHAKNEAYRLPTLNLTMARAYLSAHDAKMSTRTWIAVMREMGTHGIASTQERCARTFCSKAFDSIRHKPLVQKRQRTCFSSFTATDTRLRTTCAACTTWLAIWAGWPGRSSPSGSGRRSVANTAAL